MIDFMQLLKEKGLLPNSDSFYGNEDDLATLEKEYKDIKYLSDLGKLRQIIRLKVSQ